MKNYILIALSFITLSSFAETTVSESVYVESPTDTDHDGVNDRIYVSIKRPDVDQKISSIYEISPYSTGTNSVPFHDVDMNLLPQDMSAFVENLAQKNSLFKNSEIPLIIESADKFITASVKAHSLGTGRSTGCPTIGDESEILAAKAVIDWLNGRAKAWNESGDEVKADWANGNVGMTGVSYNGTLPIMVASSGVEGLKAIVPIAAISNWYDYYRANGLVVGPGGYIGEDADVLGYFVVNRGKCKNEMEALTRDMGREHGDFSPFWVARNHLANAKKIKAATFIVHGQSDWNVKQKHAIQLWEALDISVPKRMVLHRGGHGVGSAFGVTKKIQEWFAYHLDGIQNDAMTEPLVQVEHLDSSSIGQKAWPHENTRIERFYMSSDFTLSKNAPLSEIMEFTDLGKNKKLDNFLANPGEAFEGRLFFLSEEFKTDHIFSGTPKVHLRLAVKNRHAANITVAVVEYNKYGKKNILTRGWVDPQNHSNITRGDKLEQGRFYDIEFNLEPKQQRFLKGSKFGILIASTDYEYTLRPDAGTEIQVEIGEGSFIDLSIGEL